MVNPLERAIKSSVFQTQTVKTLETSRNRVLQARHHSIQFPRSSSADLAADLPADSEVIAKLANRSKKPKLAFQMVEELRRGTLGTTKDGRGVRRPWESKWPAIAVN